MRARSSRWSAWTLRSFHRHGELRHDVHVFGLLRDDWRRSPLARAPAQLTGEPPPAFVVG
jgi:hypothetical protein